MKTPPKPAKQYDGLNRRLPWVRNSTGKFIELRSADLVRFDAIQRHGCLDSKLLHEFTKTEAKNVRSSSYRLGRLFHEDNTKYKGPYLERPPQQFGTVNSYYHHSVYDLNKRSLAALGEAGMLREHRPAKSTSWVHDFLLASVTASAELGTLRNPEKYRFICEAEALARLGIELYFPVSYSYTDIHGKPFAHKGHVKPDALFGIEYLETGTVRWFLVEVYRHTATGRASDSNAERKDHRRSLLQYRKFIFGKGYEQYFGKGGVVLLHVTANDTNRRNIMKIAEEVSPLSHTDEDGKPVGKGFNFALFRSVPDFDYYFKPPGPMYELFDEPWERACRDPYLINAP